MLSGSLIFCLLTLCILQTPKQVLLVNSEDSDSFHQGLHCLLRLKQHSEAEIHVHHYLENSTSDPSIYTMGSPIVSICILENPSEYKRLNYSFMRLQFTKCKHF